MQQIINFVLRYKNFLLYALLLLVALSITIQSHSYHKSKFFNSANSFSGGVYQTSFNITSYFDLNEENEQLLEENLRLRNLLFNQKKTADTIITDSTLNYTISTAQIIKNSYARSMNYITINKGTNHDIGQDMGVITTQGIIGIVENTSENFSMIQSILNTKSTVNAKIKNTAYFGSLIWNTEDTNIVQLTDVPRLVKLHVGDTIVTGAMSSIFPENIPIGTIKNFDLNSSKSYYNININLFNDMTNIKNVYIINNIKREEILELESNTTNGQ